MNYFVKESQRFIWHFYHNSHGICYCKMTDECIGKYQVLLSDGSGDFDVIVDDENCIHLVYQSLEGDIIYVNHIGGQWRRAVLLKSKTPTFYHKAIRLFQSKGRLLITYVIRYNGNRMLVYQEIGGDTPPVAVDCIGDDYSGARDGEGNIYLLFYSETNKGWGVRTYDKAAEGLKEFFEIPLGNKAKRPFLYVGFEGELHILYEKDTAVMEYCGGEHSVVGTGRLPLMLFCDMETKLWEGITDNKVYIKNAKSTSPTVIMSGNFSPPVRFGIRYTGFEAGLWGDFCTGNIVNGKARLYGVNNFFAVSNSSDHIPDGQESPEIKKLKIRINQLNTVVEGLQARMEKYDEIKADRRLAELETAVFKNEKLKF